MITKEASKSHKLPQLSDKAFKLFVLLIPHFNSRGKMNGQPEYIKGEVCPLFDDMTIPIIKKCLAEISGKTNVKWFQVRGLWYLHSINFSEHQPGLREDRMGEDTFPDYSGTTPGVLPREVEGEVEGKVEDVSEFCDCSSFDEFWTAYPKKVGKIAAFRAWKKIRNADALLPKMLDTIAVWRDSAKWTEKGRQYCPNPATWLNAGQWEDDPPPYEPDEFERAGLSRPMTEEEGRALLGLPPIDETAKGE